MTEAPLTRLNDHVVSLRVRAEFDDFLPAARARSRPHTRPSTRSGSHGRSTRQSEAISASIWRRRRGSGEIDHIRGGGSACSAGRRHADRASRRC